MDQSSFCPVVEVTRGDIVESLHFGAAAVVDAGGRLIASIGDPEAAAFLRSSSKPFQAMPFIEMGGAEKFGLTEREIGLICSSHSGTDEHFQTVNDMQRKIGIGEANLMCGSHPPFHGATSRDLILRGETPTPNRHNCSGKHTGMLAHALMRGQPLETYLERGSIVQQTILTAFAEMCGVSVEKVELGTDGCSAPVFAVPLRSAALAFARLADPSELSPARADACRKIWRGMTNNPDMVAGPERFDTIFMTVMKGRALSKAGAEGYQGLAILPSGGRRGLGITIKVSDGDLDWRASGVIAVEILRQLGVISTDEAAGFGKYAPHPIQNWRKLTVGEIRPCFQLKIY
ncbi:MAG: asparaginase [Anaerolineaceae bacterium]